MSLRLLALAPWKPPRRARSESLSDVSVVDVQPGVVAEIGWLATAGGSGPSVSVYVLGEEVLRADCLAGDGAHLHGNLRQAAILAAGETPRWRFPRGTVEEHVARAVYEVEANLGFWTAQHTRRAVRRTPLDSRAITRAAAEVRRRMLDLAARRGA